MRLPRFRSLHVSNVRHRFSFLRSYDSQRRKADERSFGEKVGREIGEYVDLGIMVYDDDDDIENGNAKFVVITEKSAGEYVKDKPAKDKPVK